MDNSHVEKIGGHALQARAIISIVTIVTLFDPRQNPSKLRL